MAGRNVTLVTSGASSALEMIQNSQPWAVTIRGGRCGSLYSNYLRCYHSSSPPPHPILRLGESSQVHSTLTRRYKSTSAGLKRQDPAIFDRLEPRTFSIVAHVDHGKSTLADRLLELTGTIATDGSNKQVLDSLRVEQERGITVKAQAVSMVYDHQPLQEGGGVRISPARPGKYLLQMLDTPGHVDFGDEVKRSLSACQTALLLIDATQGVQAQTISVFQIAQQRNLCIIPVLNKIDLPASDPERCERQLLEMLDIDTRAEGTRPLYISAKTGQGVNDVLRALVDRTEALEGVKDGSIQERQGPGFRALVIDTRHDSYKGVFALLSVADGAVRKGDRIASAHTGKVYQVLDLGVNSPLPISTGILRKGQIGWLICNMKTMSDAVIGDTFHLAEEKDVEPLEGFTDPTPMVYAGVYPVDSTDFLKLEDAIKRLALNDRSVSVQRESSLALGQGCRLGFLGTLHLDVFRQRLADEHDQAILVTAPTVPYKLIAHNGSERIISSPADFPDDTARNQKSGRGDSPADIQEPVIRGRISCPEAYAGAMLEICAAHRGEQLSLDYVDTGRGASGSGHNKHMQLVYRFPLAEVVTDFVSSLKSASSGFAQFDYADDGYASADLVKLSFLISGTPVDALAMVLHRSKASDVGRMWAKKLKDVVPRQQFEVAVQAMVGSKVVARETLSSYRKDVTAGLYGGHYERKLKHLNKQKEGKKRLRAMSIGRVQVPTEAFVSMLDTRPKSKDK